MSNIYDQFNTPEDEKKYEKNIYREKFDEPESEPEFKSRDLMLNRGKAAHQMLSAVPESAAQLVKDFLRFAADPKSVIEAGGDAVAQTGNKIGREVAEVVQGQELEQMPERQEMLPDAIWEGIKKRYGGGDELATTLMTDPIGMSMDVGVLKRLKGFDPLTGASKVADKVVTKGAESLYADAVGIPKKLPAERRQALIDEGMNPDARVTANRKGLDVLDAEMEIVGNDINKIISDLPILEDGFSVQSINKNLNDLMRSYEGVSGGNKRIAKVKQIRDDLQNEFLYRDTNGRIINDAQGRPIPKETITAAELQKYKKDVYSQVYKREVDPSVKISEGARTKTMKQQGRAAKDELNRTYPELIDPNIKWGKLAQLKPMVERAMERFTEIEPGMIPYLSKKIRDPEWRSRIAISLRKMADGDIDILGKELGSRDLRIVMVMAGRNEQMVEEEFTVQ